MTITFVGSDSGEDSGGANITLTLPTHEDEDFGLIYARADEAGTVSVLAVTSASGWTELFSENPTSGRDRVEYMFYKVFTSDSETDPVMTNSTTEEWSASVHVFRNVDPTTPFDTTYQFDSGQNDTTPTNPAITTVSDNAAIVLFQGSTHDDITVAGVPTTPTSLTLGETILGGANDHRGQIAAYKLDVGSAATITPTAWTHTSSPTGTAEYTTVTVALRNYVAPAVVLSASANISASGEATTAQLTAPASGS